MKGFWPWHLWWIPDGPVQGADCACCGRAIAVPVPKPAAPLVCCYCLIDDETVEEPFH